MEYCGLNQIRSKTRAQGRLQWGYYLEVALEGWIVVVQLLSHVQLFATPWMAAHRASLTVTTSQSLLKLMSIELVMPSNDHILCRPLLLPPSIFPSIRVLSSKSALHIRWPKDWSFSISPSNEYSGLIFFRIDWFDLLAVQRTLKSLLQHHNSRASILRGLALFWSSSHIYTWLLGKPELWLDGPLSAKWCLCFLIWFLGLS